MIGLAFDDAAICVATVGADGVAARTTVQVAGLAGEDAAARLADGLRRVRGQLGADHPSGPACLAVPAWYHDGQRTDCRNAARRAGFEVRRLLNEPSALALAQWLVDGQTHEHFVVCERLHDRIEASVLHVHDDVVEVLAVDGAIVRDAAGPIAAANALTTAGRSALQTAGVTTARLVVANQDGRGDELLPALQAALGCDGTVTARPLQAKAIGAALLASLERPSHDADGDGDGDGDEAPRGGCLVLLAALPAILGLMLWLLG